MTFVASLAVLVRSDRATTEHRDRWRRGLVVAYHRGHRGLGATVTQTTGEGRIVALALMVAGIALPGVVTAAVASWFVERIGRVERAEQETSQELANLGKRCGSFVPYCDAAKVADITYVATWAGFI